MRRIARKRGGSRGPRKGGGRCKGGGIQLLPPAARQLGVLQAQPPMTVVIDEVTTGEGGRNRGNKDDGKEF